jgi:hypothetical protein
MTLGRQLKLLEDKPEFGKDLQEYHYGIRYEEKPLNSEREEQLLKRIEDWK